ncbi:MAG: AraC protein arabinose-binding/dimerization [Segetibacter sp.]|jgi:AraC-like DNA-binding protein|nr:AraC protein arabinose-binding/dimerization [Segetibacter sp.]
MINYNKYLPVSTEDENWGLYVLNAGCNRISKKQVYPPVNHPAHHYFNWSNGRIFDEFQVIYISNGEGVFESKSCGQKPVKEGTIILLFPGEWHRYKPDEETGWEEYWIGFKGDIVKNLVVNSFFEPQSPLLYLGINEPVINLFAEVIEKTKEEKPGYQQLISGAVMHLLGTIHSQVKEGIFKQEDIVEAIVNKARIIFRTKMDEKMSIEEVAEELNVSYSWFRKAFKKYTGIAPGQYLLQLKIEQAKKLLSNPSKSIKEIAFDLHFESSFYFSNLFKEKTRMSPEAYRKNILLQKENDDSTN